MKMSLQTMEYLLANKHILGLSITLESILGDKGIQFLGAPGTVGILNRVGTGPTLAIDPMQDWSEDLGGRKELQLYMWTKMQQYSNLPGNIKLIVTDEIGMVSTQGIENKSLIRFRDPRLCEASFVRQIHFCRNRSCVKTRSLRIQF